ncbi:thioredoxin-disulfide reductase [Nanoarchaeota archaeon NZ13-N]|nr:MAG: thioredoxin-disulfide reductase [Nanoarchaeota archaeon NZ13-N]
MTIAFSLQFQKKEEIDKEWDVIIIGGGPAGYTAAIYCGRYKLKTLIITKDIGGLLNEISALENYPGFKKIKGSELAKLLKEQADEVGVKTILDEVLRVEKNGEKFKVISRGYGEFYSKAVIVATGSARRKLGVPGENLPGVSYCAECDAPLFKNKVVAVVGGGNTAFHDALVLSEHASKVYIIHRREEFRAEPILVEEAKRNPKIEFLLNKVVVEMRGEEKVEEIVVQDIKTNDKITLKVDGVFVSIGMIPVSGLFNVNIDENGYIIVDDCMKTNIKGLLAAGDVTNKGCGLKQVIIAAGMGAIAALSAFMYIKMGKW